MNKEKELTFMLLVFGLFLVAVFFTSRNVSQFVSPFASLEWYLNVANIILSFTSKNLIWILGFGIFAWGMVRVAVNQEKK